MCTDNEFISRSEEKTGEIAARILEIMPATGGVIALHGELGAGKTVFARAFAKALKIDETVSSPTYTIIQEYLTPNDMDFYHLDLYRIENSNSALAFGVDEYLNSENSYVLIEWPERIKELIPDSAWHIYIEHISENERKIILKR